MSATEKLKIAKQSPIKPNSTLNGDDVHEGRATGMFRFCINFNFVSAVESLECEDVVKKSSLLNYIFVSKLLSESASKIF